MQFELSGSRPKNIREQNIKSMLTLFHRSGRLAIRDVIKYIPLSMTTARIIINQLVEHGMLFSAGKGTSTKEGGKRPEWFEFNPNYQYILVCRFQNLSATLTLINLRSEILHEMRLFDLDKFEFTYDNTIKHLAVGIEKALESWGIPQEKLFRIVLSCTGVCNQETGVLYGNPSRLDKEHFQAWPMPIVEDVQKLIHSDIPVYIDCEDMFIGYAELLDQDNENINCFVSLGEQHCCIINGKEVQRGYLGFVGYHSHTILDHQSDLTCECGSKGCFSSLVRESTLIHYFSEYSKEYPQSTLTVINDKGSLSANDIFSAANDGDMLARKIVDTAIYWHYIKIMNLIVVYNPEKVVISGLYRNAGSYFYERFDELKEKYPHLSDAKPTFIASSKFDTHTAEVIGAGLYVFNNFFVNEYLQEK